MKKVLSLVLMGSLILFLSGISFAQEADTTETPDMSIFGEEPAEETFEGEEAAVSTAPWGVKGYVNFGPIEPWGDPGTGAMFNMGFKGQFGVQLNPGMFLSLPSVLNPLSAEVMVGYTTFNHKTLDNVSTSIISFSLLGRYDVTDLIVQYIGFEYPALSFFGFGGFQFNNQSWDYPNRTVDSQMAFGVNLGLGVKYFLDPVEIDLRFTQANFIMGEVKDSDGNYISGSTDYGHGENGFLLGIGYVLK